MSGRRGSAPTIVDAEIRFRTDFVPRRGRNVRKGQGVALVPVSIGSIAGDEAPVVMKDQDGIEVRTVDGLLYVPVRPISGGPTSVVDEVRMFVDRFLTSTCTRPDENLTTVEPDDGATVVSSRRDFVSARLQERLDEEFLIVDGVLHTRAVSAMIPIEKFAAFLRTDASTIEDPTGSRFVSGWFPSPAGRKFVGAGRKTEGRHLLRALPKTTILDDALHRVVSDDPRNVDLHRMAWNTPSSLEHPHLLHAVAVAEAQAGTPVVGIERILRSLAGPADLSKLTGDLPRPGIVGSVLSLQIMGDDPHILTALSDPSWGFLQKAGVARLLFPGSEKERMLELANSIGTRKVREPDHGYVKTWNTTFDFDAWNLKSSLAHILARVDGRVGFLPKDDVDALARLSAYLRDWQADPRLVEAHGKEQEFVRDAAAVVSLLDDPVFEDVGREWFRDMARSCCAVVLERTPGGTAFENDAELRGFSF